LLVSLDGDISGPTVNRLHFHEFLSEIHQHLHVKRQAGAAREALSIVAKEIATGCPSVLCLDEFQVTNIADAVILQGLFEALFAHNSIVVFTCNRPPEDLYKDGLNHMIYMPPFIQLLRDKVTVHHLASPFDYRKCKGKENSIVEHMEADYLVSSNSHADLDKAYCHVTGLPPERAKQTQLQLAWGRQLRCRALHAGVAKFDFEELCCAPLSAEDFLALISKNSIHTLAIAGVPRFTVEQHNEARRFTNLIDCLYEHHCRLLCTAEAEANDIMKDMEVLSHVPIATQTGMGLAGSERSVRKHGDVTFEVSEASPCRPDTFATAEADAEAGTGGEIFNAIQFAKMAANQKAGPNICDPTNQDGIAGVMSAALVSLQESGFAARRCASRLHEMSTAEYKVMHKAKWGLN